VGKEYDAKLAPSPFTRKKAAMKNKTNIDRLNNHNLKIKQMFYVYDTDENDEIKKTGTKQYSPF
jgi:hypothetical protein